MKNIHELSKTQLLADLSKLVREERRITVEILTHLREVERRRLHAELGFASLFEYAVKSLGYSEASAYRRISAMRALKDSPELEEKLRDGRIHVTAVSQVQSFVRKNPQLIQKKADLFKQVEMKSKAETERLFATLVPGTASPEKQTRIDAARVELKLTLDQELQKKLALLQDLLAHQLKHSKEYSDLFRLMSDLLLARLDPMRKGKVTVQAKPDKSLGPEGAARYGSPTGHSRYIPTAVKAEVWKRDQGRCTFMAAGTGRHCESRTGLQVDHIRPFAKGGSSRDSGNLRLLCPAHNRWEAIGEFGQDKMMQHFRSKRHGEETKARSS